jgi:hypothetical protein
LPPGYGRDRCDPNHTLEQPCALATETDIANLNFTDGNVDVFSFLLKGGRQYRIAAQVGAAGGLDPSLDVFLAGRTEQPIGQNDDAGIGNPSAVVTITVSTDAWYLVQVSNRAPGSPEGKVYTLSARSVAPGAGSGGGSAPTPAPSNPDDLIGNAYDVAHAVRLAWDVPYDLTMRCPDPRPGACFHGRHSFVLLPVKVNVPLVVLTYDLGAGTDTVLSLYQPDPNQTQEGDGQLAGWSIVASNDDVVGGWTLRSQLRLIPSWSGEALLVIAPSERADLPVLPADGRPGRYRLIAGPPAAPAVKAVLAAQTDLPPTPTALPTPTPRPTSQPAPITISTQSAQDNREVIKEACVTGQAVVATASTTLYAAAPPGANDQIASYPAGALVQLLGQCYGGWVKVQPSDSVTPGWMRAAHLRPEALDTPSGTPGASAGGAGGSGGVSGGRTPTPRPGTAGQSTPGGSVGATPAPTPGPLLPPALATLEPLLLPTVVVPGPVARQVTIALCRAGVNATDCAQGSPLSGVRVELLLVATRTLLTGATTGADGQVTLSTSTAPGSQLVLSIPTLGLETPLPAEPVVAVRLPTEVK